MSRRRFLLACAAGVLLHGCGRAAGSALFPPLALQPLDQPPGPRSLPSGPILVNFWATWCAPCRGEMASLERLTRRLASRVRVIGITVDEDLNLAAEWLRRERIGFDNFADPGMRVVRAKLAIDALPETFIVAPDARIAARIKGARQWDTDDSVAMVLRALG